MPLKRSPLNRRRVKPRRTVAVHDKAYREWIASHECVICGWPSECCHVRGRRMWGDYGNCFPACRLHHAEQHAFGIKSFQARHNIDLILIAAAYGEAYAQAKGPAVAPDLTPTADCTAGTG